MLLSPTKAHSRALPCCMLARTADQRLVLCYCNVQLMNWSAVADNLVWEASDCIIQKMSTVQLLKEPCDCLSCMRQLGTSSSPQRRGWSLVLAKTRPAQLVASFCCLVSFLCQPYINCLLYCPSFYYIHTYKHTHIHTYIYTSIHPPYIHTYIHIYIHTYIYTYIHPSIHPSIHTYIHQERIRTGD